MLPFPGVRRSTRHGRMLRRRRRTSKTFIGRRTQQTGTDCSTGRLSLLRISVRRLSLLRSRTTGRRTVSRSPYCRRRPDRLHIPRHRPVCLRILSRRTDCLFVQQLPVRGQNFGFAVLFQMIRDNRSSSNLNRQRYDSRRNNDQLSRNLD